MLGNLGINTRWAAWCLGAAALLPAAANAQSDLPLGWFVQGGFGTDVVAVTAGATADWNWQKSFSWGLLTGNTEASVGRWRAEQSNGSKRSTSQIGITPALRLYFAGVRSGWYGEAGIGANYLWPSYSRGEKVFSTRWNFGDHLAVGHRFGERGKHELAFRIQHYSNASYRKPNPGENFFQLRYVQRFD